MANPFMLRVREQSHLNYINYLVKKQVTNGEKTLSETGAAFLFGGQDGVEGISVLDKKSA